MGKFKLTLKAKEDLSEIVAFVARDNIDYAISLGDRLVQTFRRLAENPMIGRERPDLILGLRSFPVGSYLVLYRVWAGKVAIVRVVHAARDLNDMLGEGEQ